jgi:hypothetical protein
LRVPLHAVADVGEGGEDLVPEMPEGDVLTTWCDLQKVPCSNTGEHQRAMYLKQVQSAGVRDWLSRASIFTLYGLDDGDANEALGYYFHVVVGYAIPPRFFWSK